VVWDPAQYEKFKREREQPFEDLVALGTFRPGMTIVDLGCGTGELTARVAALSPGSSVVGLDSSAEMLAKARKLERPGLSFAQGTIESWRSERPLDLIFSHAALHWVEDHDALFARLAGELAPGGQLLVQVPSNHGHVSHRTAQELAAEPEWRERLGGFVRRSPVLEVSAYAELLHARGLERPLVLEKVYGHVLPDSDAVLEWLKGTLLLVYLDRLGAQDGAEFLAELGERFRSAMPRKPYYFAFRRTLLAARRG
jgi:trans-aconitate 2-methyltransferase